MMKRRIFLWIGLSVLLVSWGLGRDGQASSAYAVGKSPGSSSLSARVYQVKKGDTLAKIAGKKGVSVAYLREVNGLRGSALKIGQKLALYRSQGSKAAEASGLAKHQAKSAPEPGEEDDAGKITGDSAWSAGERPEQEQAALFGPWNNPEEQRMLVKVAKGFLGAPYRLGGSSARGLDCSGFVRKIYRLFNIDLPRTAFEQSLVGRRVQRSELVPGDLLFFNTSRRVDHVGIYIGNNEFVHASSCKRMVSLDNLNMPYFDKRFVQAVRLKGSDEGRFVANHRPDQGS